MDARQVYANKVMFNDKSFLSYIVILTLIPYEVNEDI